MRSYSTMYRCIHKRINSCVHGYISRLHELQHNQYKNHFIIKTLCIMFYKKNGRICRNYHLEQYYWTTVCTFVFALIDVMRGSTGVGSPIPPPLPMRNLKFWTHVEGDHRHELNAILSSSFKIDHLRYKKVLTRFVFFIRSKS